MTPRAVREVLELYPEEHRASAGIWAKDRRGSEMFYPIMSLSIAAVEAPQGRFASHHEIAARVSEVKEHAKSIAGNTPPRRRRCRTVVVDRLVRCNTTVIIPQCNGDV